MYIAVNPSLGNCNISMLVFESNKYCMYSLAIFLCLYSKLCSVGAERNLCSEQNNLIKEGRDMVAILYTYRSCVKALPQVR